MLSIELCFILFTLVAVAVGIWQGIRHGWPQGLGAGMAIALVSASWFEIEIAGKAIGVPTAVSVTMLLLLTFCDPKKLLSPLGCIDLLVGAIAFWRIWVDVTYGQSIVGTSITTYGEWVLPFAAGRYAMVQSSALQRLAPWFVSIACVIAGAAMFESLTSLNLWSMLFHEVDNSVLRPTDKRYDFVYRAIANVRNPIFLGILLLTLLPWPMALRGSDPDDRSRTWYRRIAILMLIGGVLSTVSRGPFLALIIATALGLAISNRMARYAILVISIILFAVVYSKFDTVVTMLDTGVNERGSIMQLNGEAEAYDGTRHRLLILKLYTPLIAKGGARGYGSVATHGFPPKIPGLPRDQRTRERLGIVDNSYLLIGLRLGYVGLALFLSMLLVSATSMAMIFKAENADPYTSGNGTMLAFACTTVAVICSICFVYWDYDFGFWILFYCGIAAGIVSQRKLEGINYL